jgi:hypothetical protein
MNRTTLTLALITFSASIAATELSPIWLSTTPAGQASACTPLVRGETIATKIAKSKALAELSRSKSLTVKSNQSFETEVSNGKLKPTEYKETTQINSNEEFKTVGIIDQAILEIEGVKSVCVLVSPLPVKVVGINK